MLPIRARVRKADSPQPFCILSGVGLGARGKREGERVRLPEVHIQDCLESANQNLGVLLQFSEPCVYRCGGCDWCRNHQLGL